MDFKSPLEAFLYWEKKTPDQVFLNQPIYGKILQYTYKKAGEEARKIASGLRALGLPESSHIALLSKNCAHWHMSDLAIQMAGYVSVPIYPTLTADGVQLILDHSDAKAIIVGKLDSYEAQKAGIKNMPILSIGMYGVEEKNTWESWLKAYEPMVPFERDPIDLFTIIYTSGTTGMPKGVMHSSYNFVFCNKIFIKKLLAPDHFRFFSYLPLAHVAERLIATLCICKGAEVFFPESLDTFASDLKKAKPHLFFAVPRIYAKFQEKILEKIPQKRLDLLLKIPVLNMILKKTLQKNLGMGSALIIGSAAAPISVDLIHWYQKIGVTILQLYGMTEDCSLSHANTHEENKVGTVGKAHEEVSVKLSAEGEILIKNDCMMLGYYKNPELTASVFEDGYFKTGDTGEYDHEGYLTITGRVKDQFKTDKGKYIIPAPIELALSANENIGQICLVGTGIPQPIALITLSEVGRTKTKKALAESLMATVRALNPKLEKHERVEKVVIMKEEWTPDNNLTTPTLKVKRNAIEKIHKPYYYRWFAMEDKVIFEAELI
ncbi:AMP-binding protein [Gaetbulibacter aestuarii]|uniref:AMP-binding protein n=1 Tax=Gaetbulibacter aestuarii TaxID=1502358 RepID=A0ABW7N021_9FLAO